MFFYNALLKLFRSRWTLGFEEKVIWFISSPFLRIICASPHRHLPRVRDDAQEIFSFFQFTEMTWTFFFFSRLIQFHPPPSTICHDCLRSIQTRSCIMAKNILLRSRWLILLLGWWIWLWKIYTRMTLHSILAAAKMLWAKAMLASDCKVREDKCAEINFKQLHFNMKTVWAKFTPKM